MKYYQVAFFDMDGTLLDTSPGILNSLKYTIRKLELPDIDETTQRSFIGPPLRDSARRVFGMSQTDAEQFVRIFRMEYENNQIDQASLYPGVFESLRLLREYGIRTAVATNKPQEQAEYLVSKFGMESISDAVFGCDAAGLAEKGMLIRQGMEHFGAGGNGILVGDTISDAYGAKEGGVDLIGVLYGFGFSTKKDALAAGAVFAAETLFDAAGYILEER